MHIHTSATGPIGDALAGFQATQSGAAIRRARELSDAALRLRARSSVSATEDDTVSFAMLMSTSPPALSQSLAVATPPVTAQEAPLERNEDQQGQGRPAPAPAYANRIDPAAMELREPRSPAPSGSLLFDHAQQSAQLNGPMRAVSFWA